MKRIWPIIYGVLIPIMIFSGYQDLQIEVTEKTNADWIFIGAAFVLTALAPIGLVAYGFLYSKKESMRKPTWDRHPIGWWTDTLQPLRVTLLLTALYTLGAAMALPNAGKKGVMIFIFYSASTAGLFIGERLAYLVYRRKIYV